MTISGFDALFYTLAFLVPGFILQLTLSTFVPQKEEQTDLSLLRFLALSCVNYALWAWLVFLIVRTDFYLVHPYWTAAAWSVIILVSPALLGLLLAHFSQKETLRRLLQRIGFAPIHEIPTAWDYKFSRTESALWVLVTLKDGARVAGLFGSRSLASSKSGERDLYIQKVYKIPSTGTWQPVSRSEGILLMGDQIKHIEFWGD